MKRRTVLSSLGISLIGVSGCLEKSPREVTTLLCNRTASSKKGEYRVVDPKNGAIVASSPFIRPGGQTDTVTDTTQSDPCREFTSELVYGKTYEFVVKLQSTLSGRHTWTVNEQHTLQIDIHSGEIEFNRVTNPSL